MVKLACLLSQSNEIVKVENPEKEKYVTVLLYGRGVIERTIKDGKTPVSFTGYRVHAGQLIVSTINARHGAIGIIPRELEGAVVSKDFPVFNIDETKINKDYLLYTLLSDDFVRMAEANSFGATMPRLHAKQLLEMEINLAPIEEQVTIVKKLQEAEKLLHLQKQQLAKLDELVKSRFIELFGDAFEHTKLTIGDISEESTVGIANSATHAYSDSGVVLLRNQNIRVNSLDDSDLIYITEEFASNYKNKALKANDILVTRTGANVGMACIVPPKYEGCQTFTTLILRLKKNVRISPVFVCHYINSPLGKQFIDDKKVGGAQPNFGAKQLATMPIIIPVAELQSQFEMLVEQTDKSKLAVQKTLEKLETLKKSLMQQYFG